MPADQAAAKAPRIPWGISLLTLGVVFLLVLLAARGLVGKRVEPTTSLNGFDLSVHLIPISEILVGGPPKDGIPALTHPRVLRAAAAKYLDDGDLVIGVPIGPGRAYPLRILMWHENVNDRLGGVPIAVSYCPLCNSAFVFDRRVGGETREFGISGLLWNSNVLLYDRQEDPAQESLFSQVLMRAVTGPAAKAKLTLKLLSSELTTWGDWKREHPETTVLSNETGYARDYAHSPYAPYFATDRLMFPARQRKKNLRHLKNKEMVLLVSVHGKKRAYALKDILRESRKRGYLEDRLGGELFRISPTSGGKSAVVRYIKREGSPSVAYLYWFSLSSILPEVPLYEPAH